MLSWITKHHKKVQEIGTGLVVYETFNHIYDFVFYPFALTYWGLTVGGAIAVAGSVIQNVVMFWLYDKMRIDWLGAHALRELEAKENKTHFEKLATWLGKKKTTWWEKLVSPLVFITLTLPIDPLIVAAHYRKEHFKGVSWKDWGVLMAAVIAANAWWLLKVEVIVEIAKFLWHLVV